MNPKISVLLPAYNAEEYIGLAIESVLSQTLRDWELIISENNSSDDTLKEIKKFKDPRIRLFKQLKTIPPAENWDFVYQNGNGEYGCVLGADDIFEPNHLERKISILEENQTSPFVYGSWILMDQAGNCKEYNRSDLGYKIENLREFIFTNFQGNVVNPTSTVFRMKAAKNMGIRFNTKFPLMMDWYLWIELATCFKSDVLFDNQFTVKYRMHPKNLTNQHIHSCAWKIETLNVLLALLNKYDAEITNLGVSAKTERKRITAGLWALAFQQWRRRNFNDARQVWNIFKQYHPPASIFFKAPKHYLARAYKRICSKSN